MKLPVTVNTIFARMLVFNMAMIILATIIPQAVFFNFFTETYDRDAKAYNMKNALEIRNYIDDTIVEKVVNIPNIYFSQLQSNDDFIFPMENDIRHAASRILAISQKIFNITYSMDFLDSIDVYYRAGDVLFINSNVHFLQDVEKGNDYAYEWISRYRDSASELSWFVNEKVGNGADRNVTAFKRNIPYNANNHESKAIVVINIKKDFLDKFIKNMNLQQGESLLIVNKEGRIVAHQDSSKIGASISDTTLGKFVLQPEASGNKDLKNEGELVTASYVESSYNDWKYVSVLSIEAIHNKNHQMMLYILTLCALLFVVNLAMSFLFTKGAYRPFGVVLDKISKISAVFREEENIQVQNEYQMLEGVINNLAGNIDSLNEKLEANKPIIHHDAISRLITGKTNLDAVKDIERLVGLSFSGSYIFTFVIKIYFDTGLRYENRMLVNYSIVQELGMRRDGLQVESISVDDKIIVGFVNFDLLENKKNICQQLQAAIESAVNTKFAFCIGGTYTRMGDAIFKSYKEAQECCKYIYFMPHKRIFAYEDLCVSPKNDLKNQVKLLNKLEDAVRSGNDTEFNTLIDSIADDLMTGLYHMDDGMYILNSIVSTIKKTLISVDMNEGDTFGCGLREQIQNIENISDFRIWMKDVFQALCLKRQNMKKSIINNELEQKIIRYIDENIYNNVSLESVSKAVNISSSYLSRNFKALIGMGFSEYLSEKKMQCAAKLLNESEQTVKEIACQLGYNSIQHFIKLFKERYVLTPKEYQKKVRGGSDNYEGR